MHPEPDEERSADAQPDHRISLIERGPFLAPHCSCGWSGPARRSRPLARAEAAAHVVLQGGE